MLINIHCVEVIENIIQYINLIFECPWLVDIWTTTFANILKILSIFMILSAMTMGRIDLRLTQVKLWDELWIPIGL